MKLYGIWDYDDDDWLRELPSKVDDGGKAILAYENTIAAKLRAAKHYGHDSYMNTGGYCEVREIV